MDATKLDYALTTAHSSRYTQRSMVKNQERSTLFSASQLETNSFDLARNFDPLSVGQHTEVPYPYPRPCDIGFASDQYRNSFSHSQEVPLADITPYIYDPGFPSNPQPSQSYHVSSGHEAFPVNLNEDLSAQSLSLSVNSSLDLAIQTPSPTFSSIPSNYSAIRRYHEDQSRQHAQVLQQLTRSRDGRRQSPIDDNAVLSTSLEITPTGRRAEFYHAASSIPTSNIRLQQPLPPERTTHQLQHSQHAKPFSQYQYPYYHSQDLGYPENCPSEPLDLSTAHVLTQEPTSPFHASTKHISSPLSTNSATIALEPNMYSLRPGPHSNAIQPMPSTHSATGMASITSPFSDHASNLIEIESENGDEQKLTSEATLSKEDGTQNYPGTSTKRRSGKQSEGSGAPESLRTGDPKSDSAIMDGLSPPTKKRKKSKMHECQVCHKNFPRPSGLKTHMNTHNNERPYPCPYPGCNRSFGVRSNAKRHLRTHGVIPPQNTGTQPYVVDFSTPMVLEQDGSLELNGGDSTTSHIDDERPDGVTHPQRPGRSRRGRGRQFKLRWMPPSSSTRSAVSKAKGKKRATDTPSAEGELQDLDLKPALSRSLGQENGFLGHGEADLDDEEADGHTDGEEDHERDFGDDDDEQDEESDEEVDRSEEEFGASTAMQAGVARFCPGSSHHSQASSSRSSLSSSLSASASTSTGSRSLLSLHPSVSSSSLTSVSSIHAQKSSTSPLANFKSVPISSHSPPSSLQVPLSNFVSLS